MRGLVWRTGGGACGFGLNLNPDPRAVFANGVRQADRKVCKAGPFR